MKLIPLVFDPLSLVVTKHQILSDSGDSVIGEKNTYALSFLAPPEASADVARFAINPVVTLTDKEYNVLPVAMCKMSRMAQGGMVFRIETIKSAPVIVGAVVDMIREGIAELCAKVVDGSLERIFFRPRSATAAISNPESQDKITT